MQILRVSGITRAVALDPHPGPCRSVRMCPMGYFLQEIGSDTSTVPHNDVLRRNGAAQLVSALGKNT